MPWSDLPDPNEQPRSPGEWAGALVWRVLAVVVVLALCAYVARSWFPVSAVQG